MPEGDIAMTLVSRRSGVGLAVDPRGKDMNKFKPDSWPTVTPRIFTDDVARLVGFLKVVFDASGTLRSGAPTELRIGDSVVLISDDGGVREAMPAFLYVYVENADEAYQRALAAGAESIERPGDMPYGDRRATVRDSWGERLADRDIPRALRQLRESSQFLALNWAWRKGVASP
jgi:PhnB protein